MFPISCNAFGDIVAVVQLVRDIIRALDDARGAADEYGQFVHVLTSLGTVMDQVYRLAKDHPDDGLREAVLEEVRRVCVDISNATDIHGTRFDDPANPIAKDGDLDDSITPGTYVSFVDFIDDTQLGRFGVHNGKPPEQ